MLVTIYHAQQRDLYFMPLTYVQRRSFCTHISSPMPSSLHLSSRQPSIRVCAYACPATHTHIDRTRSELKPSASWQPSSAAPKKTPTEARGGGDSPRPSIEPRSPSRGQSARASGGFSPTPRTDPPAGPPQEMRKGAPRVGARPRPASALRRRCRSGWGLRSWWRG